MVIETNINELNFSEKNLSQLKLVKTQSVKLAILILVAFHPNFKSN
jgi:hypothetical protein